LESVSEHSHADPLESERAGRLSMTTEPVETTTKQLRGELAEWLRKHAHELEASRAHTEPVALEDVMPIDLAFQRALWDAGFTRRGWPENIGGTGGSAVLRAALYEQIVLEGFRVPLALATLEVMGPVLTQMAPELSARFLGACVRGDEVWCQAFSEPGAGSDLAALRCRATPSDTGFVVSGQKLWSSYGSVSQRTMALVRTGVPGHRGISMLLIDLDSPGCTVRPTRASSGRNEFAEIFFDDTPVPGDRVIGSIDRGWEVAMTLLQWERGMYAWQRQAALHARLADLARTLGEAGPAEADAIADAWMRLTALRSTSARTVRRLSAGETPGPEVSIDKVMLATAEMAVQDLFRKLRPVEFALDAEKRAEITRADWFFSRMATIYGGAIEIQRSILAERVLGLPKARAR
jgi:alkylation response protein AidB-like acyl-CoA dehydrogenase